MKKLIVTIAIVLTTLAAQAQTLNVTTGGPTSTPPRRLVR